VVYSNVADCLLVAILPCRPSIRRGTHDAGMTGKPGQFPQRNPLKGNPCTRISRDHRSAFSSAKVRVKRTLPRSWRKRAYVRDAASSCSPVRTVWVIPVPLACRAFLRSSSGTSTVILRAVSIGSHHTILNTSTEYACPPPLLNTRQTVIWLDKE